MTSPTARAAGLTAVAATAALSACSGSSTSSTPPGVAITQPAQGVHVKGNVVPVTVSLQGGVSSSRFAVYVDRAPVAVGQPVSSAPVAAEESSTSFHLVGLTVGRHVVSVVAEDGSGRRADAGPGTLNVTVDGPSVTATAPATVAAGADVPVTLSTFGVTIVDLKTDTSGRTAHYDLVVDAPLPEPGTAVTLGAGVTRTTDSLVRLHLGPGRHTIGAVLADGSEHVLNPLAAAQVSVTVG